MSAEEGPGTLCSGRRTALFDRLQTSILSSVKKKRRELTAEPIINKHCRPHISHITYIVLYKQS
jgi:hypothetical protein